MLVMPEKPEKGSSGGLVRVLPLIPLALGVAAVAPWLFASESFVDQWTLSWAVYLGWAAIGTGVLLLWSTPDASTRAPLSEPRGRARLERVADAASPVLGIVLGYAASFLHMYAAFPSACVVIWTLLLLVALLAGAIRSALRNDADS